MNDGHMHDMGGMAPSSTMNGTGGMMMHHKKIMMHMTFFWGNNAEILFTGWPGPRHGMYALALIFVFAMGFLVEWRSHSRLIRPGTSNVCAGLIQTFLHAIKVGLAYMVMLAVMSFNVGIFLAAVAGQSLGFFVFGRRVFERSGISTYEKASYLPPVSC